MVHPVFYHREWSVLVFWGVEPGVDGFPDVGLGLDIRLLVFEESIVSFSLVLYQYLSGLDIDAVHDFALRWCLWGCGALAIYQGILVWCVHFW